MTSKQANQQKPKARNGKPLMSELLTETRKYIELAEQADVDSLRQFLFDDPERPLIAMGHGGSHSSAAYAALLYGTNCGLGRAMTPYQANSLSDATLKNAKQLLVSKSVKNQDAVYIAKRMNHVNPDHSYIFKLPFDVPDGFISIGGTFAYFSLLYKAFTGDADFSRKLTLSSEPADNYTYRCVDGVTTPPDLSTITQFTVLYGSYGEPVAHKMESNMTEAGLASCVISDYRDESLLSPILFRASIVHKPIASSFCLSHHTKKLCVATSSPTCLDICPLSLSVQTSPHHLAPSICSTR